MATYIVKMFDGLEVSPYIRAGDQQNMGTGSALTSYLPLPGGGFYNNYRGKKSPQGIRPVTKSGLMLGTDEELDTQVNAWRAKIGVFGALVVEWGSGALRWQGATLQDANMPMPRENKGGWQEFTFTWITAAQNWRGVVYRDEGWTVGDDSFVIGDGSAEIGQGSVSFTLADSDETVTVTHDGSIDAPNVVLRLDTTGTWQDVTIVNETTGQQILVERDAPAATTSLEVDASARSIYLLNAARALTSIYRDRDGLEVTTLGAHGLVTGDTVRIEGTDEYDGDFYSIGSTPPDEFSYSSFPPSRSGYGTINHTGSVRKLTDAYSLTTFTDKARWFVLAPGVNTLRVIWSTFPTTATLTVEFTDHYA